MKKNFICGLDIGTFKICASCGLLEPSGKIDILASQMFPSEGLKAGRIIDSKRLSACIKETVDKLRKISGIKIRRVWTNIDSPDLKVKVCEEEIPAHSLSPKSRLKELVNLSISSHVSLGRKVVYIALGNLESKRPVQGVSQEATEPPVKLNMVIVSVPIPTISSFFQCIKDSGLILEDLAPSGCAQVQALVKNSGQDERKGNILVDIGAGLVKIMLFKNKLLKGLIILPQAAQIITEDISAKLNLSMDCAEQLKIKYGRIHSEDTFSEQRIVVRDKLASKVIQLGRLSEIIALKADYLLQTIKNILLDLNYQDAGVEEIIFTGGGSIMEGFLERAEKILGKAVRMGFLYSVRESYIQQQSALYATSIGLIHLGCQNGNQGNFYKRAKFGTKFDFFIRNFDQLKLLYQEYF